MLNQIDIREYAEIQPYTSTGGTDVKPIIDAIGQELRDSGGRGKIIIPAGKYRLDSGLDPSKISGHVIEGEGSLSSFLVYTSSTGVAMRVSGAGGFTGGGIKGLGVRLAGGLGDSNAYAIYAQGDSTFQPSRFFLDDIEVTSEDAGKWHSGVYFDGGGSNKPARHTN